MSDRVTMAEAEDRLRRTLARRAGDVPPADDPVPTLGGELTLVSTPGDGPRPRPRRRRHLVAAVAAACVAAGVAVGLGVAGSGETAEIVPAQEAPTTDPTVPPDTTGTTQLEGFPPWELPSGELPKVDLGAVPVDPNRLFVGVAGYVPAGQAPSQDIWLYATFYRKPDMAAEVATGDTREALSGAEVPADLDVAGWYPAINVWLRYEDGVLGLHSGMVPHDEMVAMAATVHRTPGTDEFTMTPPPGWEPYDFWPGN